MKAFGGFEYVFNYITIEGETGNIMHLLEKVRSNSAERLIKKTYENEVRMSDFEMHGDIKQETDNTQETRACLRLLGCSYNHYVDSLEIRKNKLQILLVTRENRPDLWCRRMSRDFKLKITNRYYRNDHPYLDDEHGKVGWNNGKLYTAKDLTEEEFQNEYEHEIRN